MFGAKFKTLVVSVLTAGALLAGVAEARNLRYAVGYPPGTIGAEAGAVYADALKEFSGGDLTARVYPLSLLNFREATEGIRQGIADGAWVVLPYFPKEFPHANMIAELSMMLELSDSNSEKGGLAFAGAMSEYIFLKCPECVNEFAQHGHVFAGSSASSPYNLICTKPVTSVADVKGTRIRDGGPQYSRWMRAFGAHGVAMSANDVFSALSQGVVDCTATPVSDLNNFRLMDVATHVTVGAPGGVAAGIAANNTNIGTWRSLSADQRRALLRASAVLSAEIAWRFLDEAKVAVEQARKNKRISVLEPEPELVEATRDFIRGDLGGITSSYSERYGVKRGDEIVAEFTPLLEKWIKLVEPVNSSKELAELYWQEAYSKVDVEKYGL